MAAPSEMIMDDEKALALFILIRRRRRLRQELRHKRSVWMRTWIQKRQGKGVYRNLLQEFRLEDPEMFRRYHRVDIQGFEEILAMVGPHIQKEDTVMRRCINPGERLAATLRFLATGMYERRFHMFILHFYMYSQAKCPKVGSVLKSVILVKYSF